MRGQPGIVVGFLDQVFRRRTLSVEPHQRIDRPVHVGYEHPIAVLRSLEQLVLLGLFRLSGFGLLLLPQSEEPVRTPPALWWVPEVALFIGIGAWSPLPVRRLQLLQQSRRLSRHYDELAIVSLIRLHGF